MIKIKVKNKVLLYFIKVLYNKFMKLAIQIPCYNEENSLKITLEALPKAIEGIDEIEIVIIDDGSTDRTVEIAKEFGVKHIVSLEKNSGLARAFKAGIATCLELGADIIVNTDGDNQYFASDIEKLVKPILDKKADIVIGARQISEIKHFSPLKKILQKLGSAMMRLVSSTSVIDAPSGFRAFSRACAIEINVFDNYTYTLETIIQAKAKGFEIVSVPVRVNKPLRSSKLISSIFDYIKRSVFTMVRMFIVYRPFRFFAIIGAAFLALGVLLGVRFLYYYFNFQGSGHIQSLILSAVLTITGVQVVLIGVLADLLSINRKLLEDLQIRLKKLEHKR